MNTEQKLIENLTAQIKLKDKLLKDHESMREIDNSIISKQEGIIETLKAIIKTHE